MKTFIKNLCRCLLVIVGVSLVGCKTRVCDYTLLSSKNVDLSRAAQFKRGPDRVSGESLQTIIIFIPTSGPPNMKEAVDKAIESVPGTVALVDGVVYAENWWFIVGQGGYVVEGTPLIDSSLPGASSFLNAKHIVSFYDPVARKQIARAVDAPTYQHIKDLARRHQQTALSKLLLALR